MRLYDKNYCQGNSKEYPVQTYLNIPAFRSMQIPAGQRVRFFENVDGSGGRSRWLYQGSYHDLNFYGGCGNTGKLVVESTDIAATELIEGFEWVQWHGSWVQTSYMIPPGDWDLTGDWQDTVFPNNAMDQLIIPDGVTVRLFDETGNEHSVDYIGPCHINLADVGYQNKVSRIVVEQDQWECLALELDFDNATVLDTYERTGGKTTATNDHSTATTDVTKSMTIIQADTAEFNWGVGASLAVEVGFEAEAGALFAKASASTKVTATVSVDVGGSKTTTYERDYTESATINELGPGETATLTMYLERQKSNVPVIARMRNKRTGAEVAEHGTVDLDEGVNAEVRVS